MKLIFTIFIFLISLNIWAQEGTYNSNIKLKPNILSFLNQGYGIAIQKPIKETLSFEIGMSKFYENSFSYDTTTLSNIIHEDSYANNYIVLSMYKHHSYGNNFDVYFGPIVYWNYKNQFSSVWTIEQQKNLGSGRISAGAQIGVSYRISKLLSCGLDIGMGFRDNYYRNIYLGIHL